MAIPSFKTIYSLNSPPHKDTSLETPLKDSRLAVAVVAVALVGIGLFVYLKRAKRAFARARVYRGRYR